MARALVLLSVLVLASCGGSSGSEGTAEGSGETGGGETTAEPTAHVAWADMTPEQRGHYMAEVVMPEMSAMFQEHDAEEFADFSCATCHGDNAHDVAFHMPNGLHPLNPAEIPAMFGSTDPDLVFMTQRVWPRMAELLEMQPYDPETHEGFSCMHCHATAAAE
jgi:hypothetical protein